VSTHQAFGLVIESYLALPELAAAEGPAAVTIKAGGVGHIASPARRVRYDRDPVTNDRVAIQGEAEIADGELRLFIPNVGAFRVTGGCEIVVDSAASDELVRVYVLGTCLAALLHQRGVLALHAGAVATPRGALVFAGDSGAGKSTLTAMVAQRMGRLVADDLCAITLADQQPIAWPAFASMRLWPDSLRALGHSPDGLREVVTKLDKYVLPVDRVDEVVPIGAVYTLSVAEAYEIEVLDGARAMAALEHVLARRELLAGMVTPAARFPIEAAVARTARVCHVTRPAGAPLDGRLADMIASDVLG